MPTTNKPVREPRRFPNTGADFSALDAATAWLTAQGYSFGSIDPMTDPQIIVEYVHPPIPFRGHDYCASLDNYDGGDPLGWGETREEAIADLIEQLEQE